MHEKLREGIPRMQKKLLAILLTLAMLLSTFGALPVFAADEIGFDLKLDKSFVDTAKATTVKVTVKDAGALYKNKVYWSLFEGEPALVGDLPVSNGTSSTGYITVPINADKADGVEYYIAVSTDPVATGLDYVALKAAEPTNIDKVITKHVFTLDSVDIEYGETVVITGTVKDGSGDEVDNVGVELFVGDDIFAGDDDEYIAPAAVALAKAKTASTGKFALVATFDDAAEYAFGLSTSDLAYAAGKVTGKADLKVKVDKDTVKTNVADTIKVTVKDADGDVLKDAVVAISGVTIKTGAGDFVIGGDAGIVAFTEKDAMYGTTDLKGEVTFKAIYTKTGTAKIKVYWEDPDSGVTPALADLAEADDIEEAAWDYTGSASYKVATAAALNVSLSDDEIGVTDYVAGAATTVTVDVWDSEGNDDLSKDTDATNDGIKKLEFEITGCGVDLDEDDDLAAVGWQFDLEPEMGGIITVKVTATFHDGSKETVTKEIEVDTWSVVVTPESYEIDKAYDFKAVVTNASGKAVNNAAITFTDNAGAAIDGIEYDDDGDWEDFDPDIFDASETNINNGTYAEKLRFSEAAKVYVRVEDLNGKLMAYTSFEVYGEEVYDVELDSDTIVTGLKEDIDITVKDADGDYIKDAVADIVIKVDGDKVAAADIDKDDEVYTLDDFVMDEAGEYEVIFSSKDGSLIGRATLTVVDPKVELGFDGDAFTDSMEQELVIKVIDPRDDSEIDADVKISTSGSFMEINGGAKDADGEHEVAVSEDGLEIDILAYDDEDNDDDDPELSFEVSFDGKVTWVDAGTYAIKPMSIKATPDKIQVDTTTTVTIEVKDANGVALADKMVVISGGGVSAESETDDAGKVVFVLKPSGTGTIKAKVETDIEDEFAEGKFQAVLSGATSGSAKIQLQLGNKTAVANGAMGSLDVAPFAENGRTFVPFRYLGEALGAYVEWSDATKSATYKLGDNVVVITEGSDKAMVNGAQVTMDAVAKIVNGRFVVGLRFVGEAFGFYVDYNFGTQAITLTK